MGSKDRDALIDRLLDEESRLPTGAIGRLARTAWAGLRNARRLARADPLDASELDLEAAQRLAVSLGQLKGVSMKMGQILSYIDVALPPEAREALGVLRTHAQPMPTDRVRSILQDELGPDARPLLDTLEATPIAAASIGQVHHAHLPDGTPVAVKVQYPEIEHAIENDFKAARIAPRIARLVYPGAEIGPLIDEARTRFLEECDYEHEARAQARFAGIYADHDTIHIPDVHTTYSTRRVLTTTYVDADGFDAYLARDPPQAHRDRMGQALFEFYLGTLFRHGLYNCDPHPGNYLFPDDGRLVLLDHGCTRRFDPAFVAKLAQLTRAVHADDPAALHAAFLDLGMVDPGETFDAELARELMRAFHGPLLEDRVSSVDLGQALEAAEILQRKRDLMTFHLPGAFLFLFRLRFGLFSVLDQLDARANWYQLEHELLDEAPDPEPSR